MGNQSELFAIVVDIDGTLTQGGSDYENSLPRQDVIDKVNKCYDDGFHIILYTARGMGRFHGQTDAAQRAEWLLRELTEKWLEKYGVKYHELHFGKFHAICFVDDKGISPEDFVKRVF